MKPQRRKKQVKTKKNLTVAKRIQKQNRFWVTLIKNARYHIFNGSFWLATIATIGAVLLSQTQGPNEKQITYLLLSFNMYICAASLIVVVGLLISMHLVIIMFSKAESQKLGNPENGTKLLANIFNEYRFAIGIWLTIGISIMFWNLIFNFKYDNSSVNYGFVWFFMLIYGIGYLQYLAKEISEYTIMAKAMDFKNRKES